MNNNKRDFYETDEINLLEIIISIWKSRLLIFITVIIFAFGSVFYSLSIPNIFTSSSTLSVAGNSGGSESNSGLNMIGSITGINIGGSGTSKSELIITTIQSRDFLRHLLTFENIKPTLAAFKSYDRDNKKITYNENIYDSSSKSFTKDISRLPTFQTIYNSYSKMLSINRSKSGFIDISIKHQSPEFAYNFLSLIIKEIDTLSRSNDLNESKDSLNYLYNELASTQEIEIRNSINQLIISELRQQMLAEVKQNYLINPIDKPYMPELKSSPNRPKICILGTILGFFIGILISLIRYFGFKKNT
jgi:uncharacterized protein involved in exopolysaccharide biosynthesis